MDILKENKQAIGWEITDLKGISPAVCTHHIYLEEEAKSVRQPQEKTKSSYAGSGSSRSPKVAASWYHLPISDSTWVSPTQVMPKKSGVTTVLNEKGEEMPTRLNTGWRVCIDYRRLNEVTRNDHFPLPFMDQLLERISDNPFYCFVDGYSGYFLIEIAVED